MNGICGAASILSSLSLVSSLASGVLLEPGLLSREQLWDMRCAFGLPLAGLFFDFMDGRVARWSGRSSILGQELDSLADLVSYLTQVSFGVAPAVLAFVVGLRTRLDCIVLCSFVCAGIARLARFNVTTHLIPKDGSGKPQYFSGLPIPSSLMLVMTMWYWAEHGMLRSVVDTHIVFGFLGEIHLFSLVWIAWAVCMVSNTLKIPKL
jgi:CDP-diacylglycerol--serine O-phosphatidyltransferase